MSKINVCPVLLLRPWDAVLPANGSALPMGTLLAYAKAHKQGVLNRYFDFAPLVNRYPPEWGFYISEAEKLPPAVWLLSSYMWNHQDNLDIAQAIKRASPGSLIIAGGPHIPGYEAENRVFLERHPYIDITARGEGEITLAEILETIGNSGAKNLHQDFSAVNGITFRKSGEIVRTADRIRSRTLDIFPSPYLTGEFDHASFNDLPEMTLETNRGCPFGCTFCDWGSATLQKFSFFDLDRIKQEIEIIAKKRTVEIYLGDSNFGAFERDLEIVRFVAECKSKYGYPKRFATSLAKNASQRLADIIKVLSEAKLAIVGLISIQTTDPQTLAAINRSNIRNEKYEDLIEIFKREKLNLSSELLIGLPWQTVQSFKDDLQFFINRKLMTIAYCTAVMPNAPMNEPGYRKKYQIVTDQNDYIVSTSTFNADQRQDMIRLFMAFQLFYGIGVLKYYLYFLQMEYSILVMNFVEDLLRASAEKKDLYPISYKLQNEILFMKRNGMPSLEWTTEEGEFLFGNLDAFYNEIIAFTGHQYGIVLEETVEKTLILAQKAVMPSIGKSVPFAVELPHDLVAYIQQIKEMTIADKKPDGFRSLASFSASTLNVSALKNKKIESLALTKYSPHTGAGFELRSPLRFHH